MAEEEAKKNSSAADADDLSDALPVNKAGSGVYIAAGVGALAVLGLIFSLMGGDDSEKKSNAAASEKAADEAQGMTKAELEERQAHLKRTQAAMIAAANEEAEDSAKKAQAEAAKEQERQAAAAPPSSAQSPSAGKAPKPAPKNTKKTVDSLDAFGSDITSALK